MNKTELDLHGKTVDEALPIVDRFLKTSHKAHVRRVWIIHGKGSGVLRQEVRQHLKTHPLVMLFAPADGKQGGEGATRVEIIS